MDAVRATPLAPDDDFGARIAEAQEQLAAAAARAGLKHDPYQFVLTAQSAMIGLFPEMVRRMDATRQPLVSGSDVQVAVGASLRVHGVAMVKLLSRGILLGAACILLASVALSGGVAYWLGHRHGVEQGAAVGLSANAVIAAMPVSEGLVWEQLIRDNPGTIAAQMATCKKTVSRQAGRQACSLPVWIESAAAATQ